MIAHLQNFLGVLVLAIFLFSNINLGRKIQKKSCGFGWILLNETQKCYPHRARGPCGEDMVVDLDRLGYKIGVCMCNIVSDDAPWCGGTRPKVFLKQYSRCYSFFDQGPCKEGEWLVPSDDNNKLVRGKWPMGSRYKHGPPKCQVIPCPEKYQRQYRNDNGRRKQSNNGQFVFAHQGKCFNNVEAKRKFCSPQGNLFFGGIEGNFQFYCFNGFVCGASAPREKNCQDGTKPDIHGGCEPTVEFE